jgi:hypothetical protein
VDLGDHRLGQPRDRQHHPAAGLKQRLEGGAAGVLGLARRGQLGKVVAGAEGAAGAPEDHDADASVRGDGGELGFERREQGRRERVELGRVAERQGRDRAVV